uniref:WGS project CAEQ00000000 data, annotated contig 614 n=1 Tax=Trypanosoma congolense (strain IL3000) TaxID=1068625 RepID=F9WH89_TRYCI|nr:unnamed protein product [Trypanosoma congolense IL3000]
MNAIFDAIDRNDYEALRRMFSSTSINEVNSDGYTPLYYACMKKHVNVETIDEILKLGAQVDLKGADGETPLYVACFNGRRDVVMLLLENGAHVDTINGRCGESVLHLVSRTGDSTLLDFFLSRGADLNARNMRKETPLFVAAKLGFHEIVYRLLRAEASPDVCDMDGKSPLYIASERNLKHITILLKSGDKDLALSKAAADEFLQSRPARLKTTEEICDEAVLRGGEHKNSIREVPKETKPLDIIDIVIPRPKGNLSNLLGAKPKGPCLSLEDVGFDAPPVIPPSLRNLPPVIPQRIGGTMMRIGTGINAIGVEPIRIDTVPSDTMNIS